MIKWFSAILLLAGLAIALNVNAQLNTRLLSNLKYDSKLNDIWGYQAPDGTEYALVGLRSGVSIVSLADPANPQEVAFIEGQNSIWRDLKTFGEYAYITTDQGRTTEGLTVIDLSDLPNSASSSNWNPIITGLPLNTCHNLYIDERGIAYLAGCNVNEGGIVMVDVASNPGQPALLALGAPVYSHDVYVQDDLLLSSEIQEPRIALYDIANIQTSELISARRTPFALTHNAWASEDGNTIFTTDERPNATVAAYDISDPRDLRLMDEFRPLQTLNTGVIPHNVHVREKFLVISYYTDGVIIVDASKPDNLIEVGNYDTSENFTTGFHGAWGAYPYLPSGLILVADIEEGLFVIEPTYVKAARLEGLVSHAATMAPLKGVTVEIIGQKNHTQLSTSLGSYKTGVAEAGTYDIRFSKIGFEPQIIPVQLVNGILTQLDVAMVPKPRFPVSIEVLEEENGLSIDGAILQLQSSDTTYRGVSNTSGKFVFPEIYSGEYELVAAKWGKLHGHIENILVEEEETIEITLKDGYQDDFLFDLNWVVSGTVERGAWVRETPILTTFSGQFVNPPLDIENDLGTACYITGNGSSNAGQDNVTNGTTVLTSSRFSISDFEEPELSFHFWFVNIAGATEPDDTLEVNLVNAADTVALFRAFGTYTNEWQEVAFELNDIIDITEEWSLELKASDFNSTAHVLEVGIDGFKILDLADNPTTSLEAPTITNPSIQRIVPNPFQSGFRVFLEGVEPGQPNLLRLINAYGQIVAQKDINGQSTPMEWSTSELNSGWYFLQLWKDGQLVATEKLIKISE